MAERRRAWDSARPAWDRSSGSDSSEEEGRPPNAGKALFDHLVELRRSGRLSAKEVCTLAFLAENAGAKGVSALAVRPEAASGDFQRRFDRATGFRTATGLCVDLEMPGYSSQKGTRVIHRIKAIPPHEALAAEVSQDPTAPAEFRESVRARSLPPSYFAHPLVVRNGPVMLPVALYMDGAPYQKRDSELGVVLINMATQTRHLIMVIRRDLMCRCGCKSWCSLYALFRFLSWGLNALQRGEHPTVDCFGRPWCEEESGRQELGGTPLGLQAFCLQIRGDWHEFAGSFGFPTWASSEWPCLWCHADRETMHEFEGVWPGHEPFQSTSSDSYEAACARCEIHIRVTGAEQHARLGALLRHDKRDKGNFGLCLIGNFEELCLSTGDRLEPCEALRDTSAYFSLCAFPVDLVFWRRSRESATRHRNPLLHKDLCLGPDSFVADVLHVLFLGVAQVCCAHSVWHLVDRNVWDIRGGTEDERLKLFMLRLKAELRAWYKQRHRRFPLETITEIRDFSVGMLGPRSRPDVALKGHETKGFLFFIRDCLQEHVGAGAFTTAVDSMVQHVQVMDRAGAVLHRREYEDTMVWRPQAKDKFDNGRNSFATPPKQKK